jgi:hypothetical protein
MKSKRSKELATIVAPKAPYFKKMSQEEIRLEKQIQRFFISMYNNQN